MSDVKRVLLKLSGEAFLGKESSGIDFSILDELASQMLEVQKAGYELAVVIGAGNIWRFRDNMDSGIDRVSSDYMGMLGTIMNSVALASAINKLGGDARVMSAIQVPQLAENYLKIKADHHLDSGRIVICAGGTGNPYFTTDSSAALRALELECNVLLKGTNTDAVYDADPKKNKDAKKYEKVSFDEVLEKDLKVMDGAAIALCRDGQLPIRVFQFGEEGSVLKAIKGDMGTLVS